MAKVVHVDTHITGPNPFWGILRDKLAGAGHVYVMETCKSKAEILEKTGGADAIVTTYAPIDREIMENAGPGLRAVVRNAIGYEILDLQAGGELGIPMCNIPDYCTEEVATHTFALLLACCRKLKPNHELVRGGAWKIRSSYPIDRLSAMTLGLVGFGRIARLVARYARALGMTVIAFDPYLGGDTFAEHGVEGVALDELYRRSHAIALNAPLTKDNVHMINADSIATMRDGVIIVNTGRGPLVSTADLVAAVESGKIKAAGLDVLEEEPLKDAGAAILKLDNVILTSHIGYDSEQAVGDNFEKTAATVIAVLNGELPDNVLNKELLKKRR